MLWELERNDRSSIRLIVDRIIDIVHEEISVRQSVADRGLLGSAVIGKHVTDLLDLSRIVQKSELAQAFTKLSAETNGLSLVASFAHSLAEQLHQVRAERFSTLQLNWKGNLEKPKSIVCRFVGPKGFAEVHIPVSTTSSTNGSKRRAK